MIIALLITLVLSIFSVLFALLPVVTIASIPIVGPALSTLLITAVTSWNAFLQTFPYASYAWQALIYAIIPFEIIMLVAKFFLGNRAPDA